MVSNVVFMNARVVVPNQQVVLKLILVRMYLRFVGRVAQSVQRLTTGWTVQGSNPGGARFSAPIQTCPGAHPASCTMGTGPFLGLKYGRGLLLTIHPFQCHGHGRVELYLYPPSRPQPGLETGTLYLYVSQITLSTMYLRHVLTMCSYHQVSLHQKKLKHLRRTCCAVWIPWKPSFAVYIKKYSKIIFKSSN